MDNRYENKLISTFDNLKKDLKEKRINEQEFEFLLGLLLKNEINHFVNCQIDSFLPEERTQKNTTLINYKLNTNLTYA